MDTKSNTGIHKSMKNSPILTNIPKIAQNTNLPLVPRVIHQLIIVPNTLHYSQRSAIQFVISRATANDATTTRPIINSIPMTFMYF